MPASTQPLRHHPPAAYLRFVCVLAAIIAVFSLNSLGPDSVNFEPNFYIAKCSPILIECLSGLCAAKPVRPGIGPVAPGRSASQSCDVGRRGVGDASLDLTAASLQCRAEGGRAGARRGGEAAKARPKPVKNKRAPLGALLRLPVWQVCTSVLNCCCSVLMCCFI